MPQSVCIAARRGKPAPSMLRPEKKIVDHRRRNSRSQPARGRPGRCRPGTATTSHRRMCPGTKRISRGSAPLPPPRLRPRRKPPRNRRRRKTTRRWKRRHVRHPFQTPMLLPGPVNMHRKGRWPNRALPHPSQAVAPFPLSKDPGRRESRKRRRALPPRIAYRARRHLAFHRDRPSMSTRRCASAAWNTGARTVRSVGRWPLSWFWQPVRSPWASRG